MLVVLYAVLISIINASDYSPEKTSRLMSFDPTEYSDSLQIEFHQTYQSINNIEIDFNSLNDNQKYDLIFLFGINRDTILTNKVDSLLCLKNTNRELKGICCFYKYQQGCRSYLQKYFILLKASSDSLGDSPLIITLGFINEQEALKYLNNNILTTHDLQRELMCDTYSEIIKKRTKNKKILYKYKNIYKCCD